MRHAWIVLLALAACGDDDGTGDSFDGGPISDGGERDIFVADAAEAVDFGTEPDLGPPARDRDLWISVGGESRLATGRLAADGTLSLGDDITLPERPGAMTYGRESERLYVGLRNGSIGVVDLTGPTVLPVTGGTGNPVYVALDDAEDHLVSAYFGDDRLRAHAVDGAPPFTETDALDSADEPHAATLGPNGLFYVPHRTGDTIHWYSLGDTGELALEGQVASDAGEGPRHIAFHPSGDYAYVIMEFADVVVLHDVAADGSLTRREAYPTLPEGFDGDSNTTADVHVTPDGTALYGSNRGHDSLAMFRIASDGTLTSLGTVSTEARPREFAMSPDGRYVIAAGQDSGFLQSYRVEASGELTSVDRIEVGPDLRWVIID